MSELDTESSPALVATALRRARDLRFRYSCEPPAGQLLAALAAGVRPGGRVLELGTGAGVGTSWIISGLGERTDVALKTVELDGDLAAEAARGGLPDWAEVITGDAETLLPLLGSFDLIFADAEAGKWTGLHLTLAALRPGGTIVVDDMDPGRYDDPAHRASVAKVRTALITDPGLVVAELAVGTGIVIATRRYEGTGPSLPADGAS